MKNEKKVSCPECGTEFTIAEKEVATIVAVIGIGSDLSPADHNISEKSPKMPTKAQDRIEALRNAGIDVNNLFAMQGANGGEYVASNKNGKLSILYDNDPIFNHIIEQGTVPNRRLFRRWVMAQMFHMISYTPYRSKEPAGVTQMIHRLGYEYQWKMLMDELYAQMKMERRDVTNFSDRNRWFNAEVVMAMVKDYIDQLKERVDTLKEKKCKGVPYKRLGNRNIFISDLQVKVYKPLYLAMARIKQAKNAAQLYDSAKRFNDMRIKMACSTPQSKAWVDAYKGSGAFFTMQNLIRFHNCVAIDDAGKRLDKFQSLAFIGAKAEAYKNGDGWRLFAVLKKMLDDNNIDIKKKMAEWHKKR
jgi:hypothetical protein